ncbi:hypothetical protein BV378_06830 [Nostoc sp. RF31YmG]|nr:hypothetical protein BV378_06830 [Nostoc sp. RF31YmG]
MNTTVDYQTNPTLSDESDVDYKRWGLQSIKDLYKSSIFLGGVQAAIEIGEILTRGKGELLESDEEAEEIDKNFLEMIEASNTICRTMHLVIKDLSIITRCSELVEADICNGD